MTMQGDLDSVSPQPSGPPKWDRETAKHALDDLFHNARHYRTQQSLHELLEFVGRFRFYSPYNAMLVHLQMQGAKYVAPAHRWLKDYKRCVRPGARPLVILQPMGPVMFVFDVAETEPLPGAPPLPPEVERPFEVRAGRIGREFDLTVENAKRDGIHVYETATGSQHAGSISPAAQSGHLSFQTKRTLPIAFSNLPKRYDLELSTNMPRAARYATLAHELGHLYAGHLGTPNEKWWPDRRGLNHAAREFEAESISYLVCARLGIANPSEEYLADYLDPNADAPPISLECVMKAAGLIEQMGREYLKLRPEK